MIFNTLEEINKVFGAEKDDGGRSVADRVYALVDNGYLKAPLDKLNLAESTIRAMVVMDRRMDAVKTALEKK